MILSILVACSDGDLTGDSAITDTADSTTSAAVDVYEFTSALTGEDSVSYSGQVFRQLLIDDMKVFLGELTGALNEGSLFPRDGDIERDLSFYLDFDSSIGGTVSLGTITDPPTLQATYDDVASGKNLVEKLAGNDAVGQHRDWSTEFIGWDADGVTTPESLVRHWVAVIDDQAAGWAAGEVPLDPSGHPVPAVTVTPEGQDLGQLLQEFLRGAIAYSQGADDYLDDDTPDKGLLQAHDAAEEGKPFTALEHAWDEGFGYFGAARDYGHWTDEDLATTPYADTDGNGAIDLKTEYNWGHSVNAGKRDADAGEVTDFTAQAWTGFHAGRQLLAETAGTTLSDEQFTVLRGHRDQALNAWELAIAATAVHCVNDLLQDLGTVGTEAFSFGDYARHWSELKGFALTLQFSRFSPLSGPDFEALHDAIGTRPVSPAASSEEREDYAEGLLAARSLLADAYSFSPANLGDDDGTNGW